MYINHLGESWDSAGSWAVNRLLADVARARINNNPNQFKYDQRSYAQLHKRKDDKMIFYHGTNAFGWKETENQGFLLHNRANKMFPNMSPCTYLALSKEEAKQYGRIVLEVKYDPLTNPKMNNYKNGCWQVRVYEPIYDFKRI